MGRGSSRYVAKVACVAFLLFLIGLCRIMLSLDSVEQQTKDAFPPDNPTQNIREYEHEILMLKDQIRELQKSLVAKSHNQTILAKSDKLTKECLQQLNFQDKALKTDAMRGRSYVSEKHAPTFSRFDMWHQYLPQSGNGDKVIDKLNGLQRVSPTSFVDSSLKTNGSLLSSNFMIRSRISCEFVKINSWARCAIFFPRLGLSLR